MTEICPTFFVAGDRIVEVAYSEWEESPPGHWNLINSVIIHDLSEVVDRLVFELPDGCFEQKVNVRTRDVTLRGDGRGRYPLSQCVNKPSFAMVPGVVTVPVDDDA